jgi:hypothetical protein
MENNLKPILRLLGKILGATALISLVVLLIGYFLHWNDAFRFSNGFFFAGAILIVLGILSITGGLTQRSNFGILYGESAGQMSSSERTQRMAADIMQRYSSFLFLLVTGLLLMGISVIIGSLL